MKNHVPALALAAVVLAFPGRPIAQPMSQHMHGAAETKPRPAAGGFVLGGVPMTREGSGTSWLPDSSPMPSFHLASGAWQIMVHGSAFVRYTSQDAGHAGARGDAKLDGPSMIMFSAGRPVGSSGRFMFRTMASLDPLIEGGAGYPLLFQSGETWQGAELVDRQHPHDLFSELAVSYSRTIAKGGEAFLYLGYPGEPALGPPAFPHRAAAVNDPDAPLGHHWQDSTHIVFGVVTAGVRIGEIKIDGSVFTGREPDEERFGFDRPRLDSWSGRLSWNPDANWSLQVSQGFLRGPEAAAPDINVRRTTASAVHTVPLGTGKVLASSFVWGWNRDSEDRDTHAFLLESSLDVGRQAIYGRVEAVQKTGHDLGIEPLEDRAFWINALTLGMARDLSPLDALGFYLGGQITISAVPRALRFEYGRWPVSISVYLRFSPGQGLGQMKHASRAGE